MSCSSSTANMGSPEYRAPTREAFLANHIKAVKHRSDTETCAICMDEFSSTNTPVGFTSEGSCDHIFCDHCIRQWLTTSEDSNGCPMCRHKLYHEYIYQIYNDGDYFELTSRDLANIAADMREAVWDAMEDHRSRAEFLVAADSFLPDEVVDAIVLGDDWSTLFRELAMPTLMELLPELSSDEIFKDYGWAIEDQVQMIANLYCSKLLESEEAAKAFDASLEIDMAETLRLVFEGISNWE